MESRLISTAIRMMACGKEANNTARARKSQKMATSMRECGIRVENMEKEK
jgi:hypothetical protein